MKFLKQSIFAHIKVDKFYNTISAVPNRLLNKYEAYLHAKNCQFCIELILKALPRIKTLISHKNCSIIYSCWLTVDVNGFLRNAVK